MATADAGRRPSVSVIVPTCNRAALLEKCLESLTQDSTENAYEIVVVDNGSTDSTAAVVSRATGRWPFVRRIPEAGHGSARALHTGALNARGELLVFVDDDMVAVRRFVAHHAEAHSVRTGDCVLGNIKSAPSRHPFDRMQAYIFDGPRSTLSSREAGPLDYWSGNVSLSRDLYLSLGGYREVFGDIGYGKDVDFGHRLVAAGIRLRFAPEALTYHHFTERFADRLRKAQRVGVACAYISETHPDVPIETALLAPARWHSRGVVWACRLLAAALEPLDRGDAVPPGALLTFIYDMGLRAAARVGVSDYRAGRTVLLGTPHPNA